MTPAEFAESMDTIFQDNFYDQELLHIKMDDLMCNVLCELGFSDGIEVFKTAEKWYA